MRFNATTLSVHERPFEPTDRSEAGHWEGDRIVGPGHRSAIGTPVERQTRVIKLIHLERADSASLHRALIRDLAGMPPHVLRSITWDQGTEMAADAKIASDLGVKIYFCDPSSPWQRPSNENTNGLLRDYFPKSANLAFHSRPSCSASRTSSTSAPSGTRTPSASLLVAKPPAVAVTAGNHPVAAASFSSVVDNISPVSFHVEPAGATVAFDSAVDLE